MRIVFILLLASFYIVSNAQKNNNAVSAQLGGNGILFSINYERSVVKKPLLKTFVGMGLYGTKEQKLTIPFGVNYLLPLTKQKNMFAEFGLGCTYTKAEVLIFALAKRNPNYVHDKFFNPVYNIGLRFHSKRGLLYKANITPVFSTFIGFIPHIGFTFGVLF